MFPRVTARCSLSALAIALALSTTSLARADEGDAPSAPPAVSHEEDTTWYGWQTLAADGTSLLALPIVAGVTQSGALGGVAVGGYFLAPPIIHAAHGRWGIFGASLGLRVAMPLIGGFLGAAADGDCRGDLCIPVGAALGVAVGALGAVALDASLLSYETTPVDVRYRGEQRKPGHVSWSPSIAPRREGGFTLGLGAAF